MPIPVLATFSGIERPISAVVNVGLGVYPSTSMLYFLPQAGAIPSIGTLSVIGSGAVALTNCAVDAVGVTMNNGGQTLYAKILDRRWAWKFRVISGYWNIRNIDGEVITATQQTPQQLATKLFNALGESGADVSALPNDGYPTVTWTFASARIELERLVTARGCEVCYNPVTNQVGIVRLGVGAAATVTADVESVAATIDPPQAPDALIGVMGETLYESMFKLEAVGLDTDGEWKLLDDLSYTPVGGWETESDIEYFASITDDTARALAQQTVYRCYQITAFADGSLNIYGRSQPLTNISQVLPLNRTRLASYDAVTNTVRPVRATIGGYFIPSLDPPVHGITDTFLQYDGSWRLSEADGLITFPKPMYQQSSSTDRPIPAQIYLTTSFGIKDPNTYEPEYRGLTFTLPGGAPNSNNKLRVDLPELATRHVVQWSTATFPPTQLNYVDNIAAIDAAGAAILSGYAAQFQTAAGSAVVYRDVYPVGCNGVVRQVQWTVNTTRGATTVAFNNYEYAVSMPRAAERRKRSQADADYLLARRRAVAELALQSRGVLRQP